MPERQFPAIGHIALTVSDLERSVAWYRRLFDAEPVLDEDTGPFHHVVWMLGGGTLLGLHQHVKEESSEPASEFRPGLDHVSFACTDRAELKRWEERLDQLGIPHGLITDAPYGSGLSFRDPDNIPLEFFAPPF
ncbi:MAG: VOC family protein [Actinomycetota bacterium]|nr:VOC family protein [Actinomycetota bacterium]